MSDAPAPQNKSARSANANELFEALDTNHDGVITREEMTRALESLGEEGRMQAVQMVYGLRARKPTPTEKLKHLSAAERKKLIASAFKNKNTKSAEADQERISQDDFRKIVLGPDVTEASEQTSVDSSDTLNNREPAQANPWNKFL